jgi:hypothetical protein
MTATLQDLIDAKLITPVVCSDTLRGEFESNLADNAVIYPSQFREADIGDSEPVGYLITEGVWGDYSGSTVDRANYLSMREISPKLCEVVYNYGGHALIGNADAFTPNLREALIGLTDYPLIDEDRLSELDAELGHETISWWIDDTFRGLSDSDRETAIEYLYEVIEDENVSVIFESAVEGYLSNAELLCEAVLVKLIADGIISADD